MYATDIQNCEQFGLLAQNAAASGWHIDGLGVSTYIRVISNGYTDNEIPEDMLKYWP
jgi:hypothetical protein